MDYAARQLNIVELLDIYNQNKTIVENVLNRALPTFYWAQKVCELSGDVKEVKFFKKAADEVRVKFVKAENEMQQARNELIRRHTMWTSLAETIEGDDKKFIRPDLYEVWVRYDGPYNG